MPELYEIALAEYAPKLLAKAESVKRLLDAAGYMTSEAFQFDSDAQNDTATVIVKGCNGKEWPEEGSIDVSFSIEFQDDHEGEGDGCNFECRVVENGGRIVGGFAPYNYTPEVWVSMASPEAMAERWRVFDAVDEAEIVELIDRHGVEAR